MSEVAREKPARRGFFALELLDDRYPALHGLRVIAILAVIQLHVTGELRNVMRVTLADWFVDRSYALFFGMDCFFVLSGFLIGSILLRSIDTSGTQNIRRFYLRRVFRTFPSFYVVLTCMVLFGHITPAQRAHVHYEYLYLSNLGALRHHILVMPWDWSLSLEEQFYLTVPLLFVILRALPSDRMRIGFLTLAVLSGLVVRVAIYASRAHWRMEDLEDALYFRTHTRYDTIVAGVLLAIVEARYHDRIAVWLKHPAHRALLSIPAVACLWLLLDPLLFGEEHEQLLDVFRWGTLTSVMYLAIVPILLHGEGPVTRWLSRPFWRRLATLGYGVYLLHVPVLGGLVRPMLAVVRRFGGPPPLLWVLALALTAVLSFASAYVLHIVIEKPALRVREWLAA